MTSTNTIEYIRTKEIKRGQTQMSSKFLPLKEAFLKHLGVAPINFFFEVLPHNNRPRLQPIFDKNAELKDLRDNYDYHELNDKIIDIFISVYGEDNEYPTEDLFVICSAFDQLSVFEAHLNIPEAELEKAISPLIKNYWCIQKNHTVLIFVFSHFESDLAYNKEKRKEVQQAYFNLLSKYDEFNYINNIESAKVFFDTKENFDKNHNGSWRNYIDG